MNVFDLWLRRAANDAAHKAQEDGARLRKEIADAEQRKAEAEAQYGLTKSAPSRLDSFEPVVADVFQCPECWVLLAARSDLTPIEGDAEIDWFRCKTCHSEFSKET